MELLKEILVGILVDKKIEVVFNNLDIDINELVKLECYNILNQIKCIILDDLLNDKECFERSK